MALSPGSSAVLTGVIVATGRWANDKPVDIGIVVGATIYAIGLSVMYEVSPQIAEPFGLLVLLAAVFTYGVSIAQKAGLIK